MTPPVRAEAAATVTDGPLRRLLRRWRQRRPAGSLGELDPHLLRDLGIEPGPISIERPPQLD